MTKWQEPPDIIRPHSDNTPPDWVFDLMKHPKRWALVMEGLSRGQSIYYQNIINFNEWRRLPANTKWEATRREMDDGKYGVWVRFLR